MLRVLGDKKGRHELLYLPIKMRQGMVHWLINNGATSDFISKVYAMINVENILPTLTMVVELAEGAKLVLKKKAQVKLRINDWVFRRRM